MKNTGTEAKSPLPNAPLVHWPGELCTFPQGGEELRGPKPAKKGAEEEAAAVDRDEPSRVRKHPPSPFGATLD